MKDNMIVKGYKGIMDLDLSSIDPKFHKEMIHQHKKDITEYKIEQRQRPAKLRYENAITNAQKILEMDRKAAENMRIERERLQKQKDDHRYDIFKRIQEQKKHGII
jgi:Na+/phosphate symporter